MTYHSADIVKSPYVTKSFGDAKQAALVNRSITLITTYPKERRVIDVMILLWDAGSMFRKPATRFTDLSSIPFQTNDFIQRK